MMNGLVRYDAHTLAIVPCLSLLIFVCDTLHFLGVFNNSSPLVHCFEPGRVTGEATY